MGQAHMRASLRAFAHARVEACMHLCSTTMRAYGGVGAAADNVQGQASHTELLAEHAAALAGRQARSRF